MSKNNGLEHIAMRNAYYREGYSQVFVTTIILLAINLLLAFGWVYKNNHPAQPQYFPMTNQNKIIREKDLNQHIFAADYIEQWAGNVGMSLYALDFRHWRAELEQASDSFTGYGWSNYMAALKASNNLKTIQSLKMVVSASLLSSPTIVEQGVVNGRYQWKLQFPLSLSYEGKKNIQQIFDITMVVMRVPLVESPERIQVNMFAAFPRGSMQAS